MPVGALAAARPSPQHPDKSRPARRYAPARPLNRAVVTGTVPAVVSSDSPPKPALQGGGGRFALVGVTG
ncbi:hypothetical protein, partial [Escherichia coli]|uniref:hypothetical protein n=1 Tax=Escherichia coli TaxID=562 RepID=UPI002B2432B2